MSCSKAAIVNISSNGGSIKEVYLWEGIQAACYRCSKVCATLSLTQPSPICQGFHVLSSTIFNSLCISLLLLSS